MQRSISRNPFWFSFCLTLFVQATLSFAAHAVDSADKPFLPGSTAAPPSDPLSPPELVKPVVPSKAEMADSAFKKLDPTGKGYVTTEDTRGLMGFGDAFRDADPEGTGKLDFRQFKKAWASYSGYKD